MERLKVLLLPPFFLFAFTPLLPAQEKGSIVDFNPDEFLVQGDKSPQILLVGSFHFDYPGLDGHKTSAEDKVDVATAAKQAEVQALLDYIGRFKPNKIVVERRSGGKVNEAYKKYLAGERKLSRNEIEQIGFRLGKRFGVDTLILGDAFPFSNSLWWDKDSTIYRPPVDSLFETKDVDFDTTYEARY